jgi:hypothetical protein
MHVFTHTCVPHEVVDAQADGRDDHGVELAGREGEVVDLADDAGAQEAVLFLLLPPPLHTHRERWLRQRDRQRDGWRETERQRESTRGGATGGAAISLSLSLDTASGHSPASPRERERARPRGRERELVCVCERERMGGRKSSRKPPPKKKAGAWDIRLPCRTTTISISLHLSPSLSISLHLSPSLAISHAASLLVSRAGKLDTSFQCPFCNHENACDVVL